MRVHRINAVTAVTAVLAVTATAGVRRRHVRGHRVPPAAQQHRRDDLRQGRHGGLPARTQVCVVGTVRGKHGFNGTTVFVLGSRGECPADGTGSTRSQRDDHLHLRGRVDPHGARDEHRQRQPRTPARGHAGGTQQFTGGTGRYEGATGFAYLAQHFEVRPLRHPDPGRGLPRGELGPSGDQRVQVTDA